MHACHRFATNGLEEHVLESSTSLLGQQLGRSFASHLQKRSSHHVLFFAPVISYTGIPFPYKLPRDPPPFFLCSFLFAFLCFLSSISFSVPFVSPTNCSKNAKRRKKRRSKIVSCHLENHFARIKYLVCSSEQKVRTLSL